MPKDRDIAQVRDVIRQYRIPKPLRRKFSELIHEYKQEGFRGSKNEKGDFSYDELCQLAQEFLEEHSDEK